MINVIAGEGEVGIVTPYDGKITVRALRARLTKEQCCGDRWAHLEYGGLRWTYEEVPILLEALCGS